MGALNGTTGYQNPEILEQALKSSLLPKVEKSQNWLDLFTEISTHCSEVEIIDVGGGLGDKFLRYGEFVASLGMSYSWNIVEQQEYVKVGASSSHLRKIKFVESVNELELKNDCQILALFSSSICYFENPQAVLREIIELRPAWVLIDRTPISRETTPATQKVRTQKGFYQVPIWFFRLSDLLTEFNNYEIVNTWKENVQPTHLAVFQGLWLRRVS